MTLLGPSAPGMAFMMKKKKYKFNVELTLEELVEVALVNEVLFAKVRLLDGGSFQEYSNREEVKDHTVKWNKKFEFLCKMSANASTGVLDQCLLRVSIRKELKGGRSYYKLGFIDVNLAEFAGSGLQSRRFLLEGYDQRHRLDNSMLRISIKLHMLSGDILFKAPSPSLKSKQIPSQDDLGSIVVSSASSSGSGVIGPGSASTPSLSGLQTPTSTVPPIGIPSALPTTGGLIIGGGINNCSGMNISNRPISTCGRDELPITGITQSNTNTTSSQASSGFGSLTKKKSEYYSLEDPNNLLIASIITDSGLSESSDPLTMTSESLQSYPPAMISHANNAQHVISTGGSVIGNSVVCGSTVNNCNNAINELGHSRNSSNTSQMSKGSGYSSFSHSQHSRQSSEGDSGHARLLKNSILSKLNHRALNTAMKLNIQATYTYQHIRTDINGLPATIDTDGNVYLTPNSSLLSPALDNNSIEEYRTPLSEMPTNSKFILHTPPSPTSKFLKSQSPRSSPVRLSTPTSNLPGLLEISDYDSGLDENYHTPRMTKIKSMENLGGKRLSGTSPTDEYSPRRLSVNKRRAPKIQSLNNLVAEADGEEEIIMKDNLGNQTIFKQPLLPKLIRNTKIGNAKFIGIDEDNNNNQEQQRLKQLYPIAKIKSLGTIPDIVAERVKYDPFLTPVQNRKNFPGYENNEIHSYDMVDNSEVVKIKNVRIFNEHTSLHEFNEADYALNNYRTNSFRNGSSKGYKDIAYSLLNPPLDENFRKNFPRNNFMDIIETTGKLKSSTPLRQSESLSYFSEIRPKSTTSFHTQQELLRSISGVPRRLLDNSQRQLSLVSTGCGNTATISPNASLATLNSNSSFGTSIGGTTTPCILTTVSSESPTENNCTANRSGRTSASPTEIDSIRSNPPSANSSLLAISGVSSDLTSTLSPCGASQQIRRPSITMNPSSGSLVSSETGSLDRMKTAAEKRKKAALEDTAPQVTDRVEKTRINPDSLIDEILKDTKLDQLEESAETSGLQLFIGRDGTASLGSHEVKSRVSAGAFKQVVMEAPR